MNGHFVPAPTAHKKVPPLHEPLSPAQDLLSILKGEVLSS